MPIIGFLSRQAISMLAAVEFQNDKWAGSDQKFMLRMCNSLMQRLTRMFERFVVSFATTGYAI